MTDSRLRRTSGGGPVYDRFQRITVHNLTTGQSWSLDAENAWPGGGGNGTTTLHGLQARNGDQLRVRYNLHAPSATSR